MALGYQDAYNLVISAGGSAAEANILARLAQPESGYVPTAHNYSDQTKDDSYGLWQINLYGSLAGRVQEYGLNSPSDLYDPATNARIALSLLRSQGTNAWANSTVKLGLTPSGPGGNLGALAGAPTSGGGGPVGTAAPTTQYKLPTGGQLFLVDGWLPTVLYQAAPGVYLFFHVADNVDTSGLAPMQNIAGADWNAMNPVNGGEASTLDSVQKSYGSFDAFWTHILDAYLGPNQEARNDPGVLRVLAQKAARPDMSDEELQNLLKATDYWKSRTEGQLAWNDLSPAEQSKRVDDMKAQLQDQWFQLTGQQQVDDGTLSWWATQVASGTKGFNEAVSVWIKAEAEKIPESPWSRTVRTEQENELQRGVDIENQSETARQLADRWGVQLAPDTLAQWGKDITEKTKSDADFVDYLRTQAQVLYPWLKQLDPEGATPTVDMATPWTQTYSRVLEKPADLFNPQVQQALQNGTPVWQFEQDLKKTPDWLSTKNANDTLLQMGGETSRRLGFS